MSDAEKDEPEGAIGPEDLVQPEEVSYPVPSTKPKVEKKAEEELKGATVTDVAIEVKEGKWGIGQERRRRLSEAGYNVKEVEAEVTRLLNS